MISADAPLELDPEYYILSLKGSEGMRCQVLLWWRPLNRGYTLFLEDAGRYKQSAVLCAPHYYNNGDTTLAIPCHEVERRARRMVYVDHKHDLQKLAAQRVVENP